MEGCAGRCNDAASFGGATGGDGAEILDGDIASGVRIDATGAAYDRIGDQCSVIGDGKPVVVKMPSRAALMVPALTMVTGE